MILPEQLSREATLRQAKKRDTRSGTITFQILLFKLIAMLLIVLIGYFKHINLSTNINVLGCKLKKNVILLYTEPYLASKHMQSTMGLKHRTWST